MNQQRLANLLFSVGFVLLSLAILVVAILREKDSFSYYENRNLATFPDIVSEDILEGDYFTELETALCDHAPLRKTLMKLKTWTELYVLQLPVVNEVVVTNDDIILSYLDYQVIDQDEIIQQAEEMAYSLSILNETISAYGGTFLYVSVPNKYDYFADYYPSYLNNRSQYLAIETTAFYSAMVKYGVNYLDIGSIWETEGNPSEYMSYIDHHYTWAGAYSTYVSMMEKLNHLTGLELKILDTDDLTVTALPNHYLGSLGRKLLGLWDSEEVLEYATLNQEIPFIRYDRGSDIPSESSVLSFPDSTWSDVFYDVFMGGDISETIIQTEREELPDVLIYGDSYTNAIETILYASFDETRSLDLRSYSTMSLSDYIQEYQPDIVVCIKDSGSMISSTGNGKID